MSRKLIFSMLAIIIAMPTIVLAATELTNAELAADTVTSVATNDTVRFVLTAKWGFVRGNPDRDKTKKDYSGSISASNPANAKIRLVKRLLWERHDKITSKANPVSWTSLIYGHWDGVRVAVTAKANEIITVKTTKGSISKTAKEWYNLSSPEVVDFGNNEILVVNRSRAARRRRLAIIWWGAKNNPQEPTADSDNAVSDAPKIDFSGTLTMDSGSYVKLSRALRFEKNDKINAKDRDHIDWTSTITTGRDGLAVIFLPAKGAALTAGFTLEFPNLEVPFSKHYTFEELRDGVHDTITIGDQKYIIRVGLKNIVRQIVRAKGRNRLYLIEDNIKKYIPNPDILSANGLENDPIVEMPTAELEAYETGDNLDYPDGTVIEEGNNKYIISNGFRRKLKTNKVVQKLIAKRLRKKIQPGILSKYRQAPDITSEDELPDGSLVTTPDDSAVWMIRGGKRQVFSHARVFRLHKLKFDNVQTISKEKLQAYAWDAPVKYPDGSLVKIPTDPKVYLIQNGKRRWIETEKDFKGLGFRFQDVVDMPVSESINYPDADPVIADEATDVVEY
jgi:hypothetical protein